MNTRHTRADALAVRLDAATTPTLATERAKLAGLSDAELFTLYRERVQHREPAEDLSGLTADELLRLYRERTS